VSYALCILLDHFGNAPIRTGYPEKLGVYTIFSILSYTLSELGPQNGSSVMAALICIL